MTVVAFNKAGDGGTVTGTGRTRPKAPLLSLSAISSTQLNITLTEPVESYSLTYQCNITEIDMPPITVTGTELEYTVDGLSPNVTYIVKCISSNGVDSCDSSVDMIRLLPQVQVTVTSGVSDGSPTLEVSWTAVPGSGITYTVRYSTSAETEPPYGAVTITGLTGTSTTLSGLEQGTRYYIWVAAVSSVGQGSYSTRVSETTYTVPGAPTDLMIYPPSGSCDQLMVTLSLIHI